MDIFVASFDPVFPGCVIRARILGALDTLTSEGSEPNIFAVPHHDARFDDMSTLEDVPEQLLNDVESFFVTYMQLEGNGEAEVQSWHDQEETYEIIREGSRAYQEDRAYQRDA
jgi:inorganic pyrophosphatase